MASISQWHEAFQTINNDIHAEVLCPECGKSFLKVDDILDDAGKIHQRGIYCPKCGENSLTTYGVFDDFINALKSTEDESVKVIEDSSRVSIHIDLTK